MEYSAQQIDLQLKDLTRSFRPITFNTTYIGEGGPAVSRQTPPLSDLILFLIQMDDLMADVLAISTIFFLFRDRIPKLLRKYASDLPAKPLHPTSIVNRCVRHPASLHSLTKSWYLEILRSFAHSMFSSHGTVNSAMTITLETGDQSSRSGFCAVRRTTNGNSI